MKLEFLRPWALALLPALWLLAWWIDAKYVRRGLWRAVTSAARGLVLALVVLALAAPSLPVPSHQAATWLLVDASDSTLARRADLEAAARQALDGAPEDLSTGVIAFGANAMVELPLGQGASFAGLQTAVRGNGTDLAAALQLASALLPGDAAGRIGVISDGAFDLPGEQLALLQARGIAVDVWTAEGQTGVLDAQVTSVSTPSSAWQGQSFPVTVTMEATADAQGTLVLYANREAVATREVTLRRGRNTYVFQDVARDSGVVTYEAQLLVEGDDRTRNDRAGTFLTVAGAPRVLVVEGRAGEGRELEKMLSAAGMEVETALAEAMPLQAAQLRPWDAIALVNVNADALGEARAQALDQYVRVFGRGLCAFGGDDSFALGNYRGSALEQILPVTAEVRNQAELPSLALLLVIDKSGSMSDGQFGTSRMEVAKEAAMRSVEMLTPRDQVGVIAFDDASKWVVPLGPVEDVAAIQQAIGTIRAGGGTSFYSPLRDAYAALSRAEAQLKHVIFLTDGAAADNGYQQIVSMMREKGITFSTVAVGRDANTALLARLAALGEGRAYAAGEFDSVPEIFAKETYLASGAYVQNRTFTPERVGASPLTDFGGFPPLGGYLAATEKPLSTVELVSDRGDPLLAWWQYGAGRALAWTSDARGGWTKDFLAWARGADFFAGLVSSVMRDSREGGTLEAEVEDGVLRIRYTAPEDADLTGLTTRASAVTPSGAEVEVSLTQAAPGVYTGRMDGSDQGVYALRVEQSADGQPVRAVEGGAVSAYSGEYDLTRRFDAQAMARLASETGGVEAAAPGELLARRGAAGSARKSLQDGLLLAALLAFLVDIALRKLPWERAVARATARRAGEKEKGKEKPPAREPRKTPSREPRKTPTRPQGDTAGQLLQAREKKKKL